MRGPAQPSSPPDSPLGLTQSRTREQEPDDRDDQELDGMGPASSPDAAAAPAQATRATRGRRNPARASRLKDEDGSSEGDTTKGPGRGNTIAPLADPVSRPVNLRA